MDRSARCRHRQQQNLVARRAHKTRPVEFFNILTSPELLELTDALMPEHRERLYPPTVTLSMFMRQTLEADGSCQKAVNGWAVQRVRDGLTPGSTHTGGYCRARARLPTTMVSELTRETGRQLCARAQRQWGWQGRPVKLVDGTGISMPDTKDNQRAYPQPTTQATGVGFPQIRMVAVICLASGGVLDAGIAQHSGKGSGEVSILRGLTAAFKPGDVMLADAAYCNYFLIATLASIGVDVLFEQNGSRITDFRRGQSLGNRDHLVDWPKPSRPKWMTHEQYAQFPEQLHVRETRTEHQVLVTTMLDHRRVGKRALAALYSRRWDVELDLRNIKTTMGMEVLHCQTPEMNEKELWVHLLAYNLIRLLMAQAACNAGRDPRTLSFKHTLQLWTEWLSHRLTANSDSSTLFDLIAQSKVRHRPGRLEPRMRKRRPKPYQWLKKPREETRRDIRQFGHPVRPK